MNTEEVLALAARVWLEEHPRPTSYSIFQNGFIALAEKAFWDEAGELAEPKGWRQELAPMVPDGIPPTGVHVVYRHIRWEFGDLLLYVGVTGKFLARQRAHFRQSRWWAEIDRIDVQRFPSRAEAEAAEVLAIRSEEPRYNVAGRV